MTSILITGIGGMVGSHLSDKLSSDTSLKITGTYYKPTTDLSEISRECDLVELDIRYLPQIYSLLKLTKPSVIYHLAAQSYPSISWARAHETIDTNVFGTINLFEAIKLIKSEADYDPTVVVACSSAQYGETLITASKPVNEEALLQPLSPYGVSKVAQDLLAFQYFKSSNIKSIRARIFNTTGPKKKGDVVSDFVERALQVKRGSSQVINVGNLSTKRAIMDVRDLIEALILLSKRGVPGEAYNICGSSIYTISDVLSNVLNAAGLTNEYQVDPKLLRPTDEPLIVGSSEKLFEHTGWQQSISLEKTINDMFEYLSTSVS